MCILRFERHGVKRTAELMSVAGVGSSSPAGTLRPQRATGCRPDMTDLLKRRSPSADSELTASSER